MSKFLVEDDWRCPWSTHPLRPLYRGRPHPRGKQVYAAMVVNSAVEEVAVALFLEEVQAARRAQVAKQQAKVARVRRRRFLAAQNPATVIEPQSSLPGVQRTVEELEHRCRMPIDEIRATFRQGRRSAEQKALRELVEHEIREMVKHYRMDHPATGTSQLRQAREVWREFAGSRRQGQRDRAVALWAFGDVADEQGGVESSDTWFVEHADMPRKASRSQKRSQIVGRLAEALQIDRATLYRALGGETRRGTPRILQLSSGQELS